MIQTVILKARAAACGALLLAGIPGSLALVHASEPAAPTVGAPTVEAPSKVTGRPRIGLVLSGGGARGAAHVGVLRVLEELRIPIDYIAGTSMGSIVGASYASGTTVVEMEAVIAKMTTAGLMVDSPARTDQPIRRRADDRLPYFGPEIGVRGGSLLLPRGAVSGVALEAVLRGLVRTPGIDDFDRLPIPFRAMATDIASGDAVVLSKGDLSRAMRASMAVPGVISPAEIDGRLLIDGGLTRNLPVDVVRAMGADIVIAVNLGTPLLRRDQISSLLSVSVQMVNILTEQNVRASLSELRPADVLILPELGDYSAADFDNMMKTVPIGEAAARKVADRLAALSLSPAAYAAWRSSHAAVVTVDRRPIAEIRVEGVTRVNPAVVISALETRVGEVIEPEKIDADLRRIYGRGDFEHVSYSLVDEPGGRVLSIRAPEKSWGPDYLRFGLGLSTDFGSDNYFNLLASYRRNWVNSLGADWRTDVQLGRDNFLVSEFYQPLTVERTLFVAPRIEFRRSPVPLYLGSVRIGGFYEQGGRVGLDMGSQFGKSAELRLGVLRGTEDFRVESGQIAIPAGGGRFQEGGVAARLLVDQMDSLRFPRSGYSVLGNLYASTPELGADIAYNRFDVKLQGAHSIGAHTFQAAYRGSGKLGSTPLPTNDLVQWGGFLQQSGYSTGQLLGRSLDYGRVGYLNQLIKRGLLEGAYVGGSLEVSRLGGALFPNAVQGTLVSGSVYVAIDTPLGPVYLAYGQARDGNQSLNLYLGIPQ